MNSRRKRLDHLLQHRSRELDQRVSQLLLTRTQEQEAREGAERDRAALARAERERMQVISEPFEAKCFVEANDFMVSCARKRELSEQVLHRAQSAVKNAQNGVQAAKSELKKIELLNERLAAEERFQAARVEQRVSDELAAHSRSESSKRRSEP